MLNNVVYSQDIYVPSGIYWMVGTETYLWNGTGWANYSFGWVNHKVWGMNDQTFCWT